MEDTNTTILIKIGNEIVGAVQTTTINWHRDITHIKDDNGIIIDSIPGATTLTGESGYVRFDRNHIEKIFNSAYVSKQSQVMPFDMEILYKSAQKIRTIRNVWITDLPFSYTANNHIITHRMRWEAETMMTTEDHNELMQSNIGSKVNGG
jgi:hypothetical protein